MSGCVRPSLGPLFSAAAASWATVVAAEYLSWQSFVGNEDGCEPAILLVIAVFVAAACVKHKILVPAFAFALCAFVCSHLFWMAWESDVLGASQAISSESEIELELVSDPSQKDYGLVSEAKAELGGKNVRIRITWPRDDTGLPAGRCVVASGSFRAPANDEGGRWNHQQGFAGMISVSKYEERGYASGLRGWVTPLRDKSMERISKLGGTAAGLLAGIVLGNRTLYSGTELEQDFRVTGLAHLMAVSGAHLAVVAFITLWLLARLPLGRKSRSVLLTLLMIAYVALTAFAPSAMRACAMCAVGLGASGFGRRKHVLSALSACVIAFLALDPRLAFSVGFQLSVLCMVGLTVFSPLASAWFERLLPERFSGVAQGLAATLCANLVTMPVTIPLFYQLPLISPLSTLLASPLVTISLGLGIAGVLSSLVFEPAGELLLNFAGAVGELCGWVVHGLASLPFACIPLDASAPWLGVLCGILLLAAWVFWPSPDERIAPAASKVLLVAFAPLALLVLVEFGGMSGCATIAGASFESDAQVIMLDVGQGDAMVIRDGNAAVLVDTGEEGAVLLKALARHGIGKVDAILLSHKDVDHTGALSSLAGVVGVGHVYVHRDLLGSQSVSRVAEAGKWATRGNEIEGVGVGTQVTVGRFTLSLLLPQSGGDSENEDSLVWLVSFDEEGDGIPEAKGLLTGDAEAESISNIVEDVGDIAFLKVAHHGSNGAISAEELSVLRPEIALISVGEGNDYGHPTAATLRTLERGGCKVVRTDLSGDITLSFRSSKIDVKTQGKP